MDKSAQDYLDEIRGELENANHHNYIDLPEKLFNRIKDSNLLMGDELYELELAKIISEEFYNNI